MNDKNMSENATKILNDIKENANCVESYYSPCAKKSTISRFFAKLARVIKSAFTENV